MIEYIKECKAGSNSVQYMNYNIKGDDLYETPYGFPAPHDKFTTSVCFSEFTSKGIPKDIVLYKMVQDTAIKKFNLNEEEQIRWVEQLKAHKLLPDYVESKKAIEHGVAIDCRNLSPTLFYIYVSFFRYIREAPILIRNTWCLEAQGINFFAAFTAASTTSIEWMGHHVLTVCKGYGRDIKKITEVPIRECISLKRFVNDPTKYDKRDISADFGRFNCNTKMSTMSKIVASIPMEKLGDPIILKILNAKTDVTSRKHVDKLLETEVHDECDYSG